MGSGICGFRGFGGVCRLRFCFGACIGLFAGLAVRSVTLAGLLLFSHRRQGQCDSSAEHPRMDRQSLQHHSLHEATVLLGLPCALAMLGMRLERQFYGAYIAISNR